MAINDYYTQGQGYPLMGNERFQGENEIYQNMDQNMNYRGPDPFGSFNSGIGTFYGTPNIYPGSAYSPHRGFEEMQFDETVQTPEKTGSNFNFLSMLTSPFNKGIGLTKKGMEFIGERFQRPEAKQRAYEEIMKGGTYKGKGGYELYDTPSGLKIGSDILGTGQGYAKNFDSMFGSKSLEEMEEKKLDWARNRIAKGKAISQRLQKQLDIADATGGADTITTPTITGGSTSPNVHGGGSEASFTQTSPGGISQAQSRAARQGMTGWRLAEGGRVGLYAGGPPEMEEDTMTTMEFMKDQNIPFGEMASMESGQESTLEDIYYEFIGMGFSPEEAAKKAREFYDQMSGAPQEDLGIMNEEGIASIV
jgi:hypothetical protein